MVNKNVCIVGPSKQFLSGISYYTLRLSNALADDNNVSVVCFRQLLPTFIFPGRSHVGKDITSLDFLSKIPVYDGMDYNNPYTWWKACSFVFENKPDIIVLQWWTCTVAHMHLILKYCATLKYHPKIIIEFHEVIDPLEESILPIKLYSKVTGTLLRNGTSTYITHSESDKKLVAERYNINLRDIHVVPHGLYDQYGKPIDKLAARRQLNINEDYVILSFGLIRRYKGTTYLIQAFEKLPPEILNRSKLLIVGEVWEDKEELLTQIQQSMCKERIILVDEYIPDDKVKTYFSAADVIVLPYLRASQSGIAHIAMTFGKPIIVSEVGGLKESMANYKGTFFIPPGDTTAITNALIERLGTEEYYEAPNLGFDNIVEIYNKVLELV